MTRPPQVCGRCGRAVRDAYLCAVCLAAWSKALRFAVDFAAHADTYRARFGTSWRFGQGSRSAVRPLPFDPRVTPVLQELKRITTAIPDGDVSRADPELAEATYDLTERIRKIIDAPAEMVYLGTCGVEDCPASLYFEAEALTSFVRCPRCDFQHEVAERRAALVRSLMDHLATVVELSRLLRVTLGAAVSEQSIQRMVNKGLLVNHGHRVTYDCLLRPRRAAVYRIGDVIDVVAPSGLDQEYAKRSTREVTA